MALDSYRKEQDKLEKEAAAAAGTPEKAEDTLTLKKIMASADSSDLFGKMLEKSGGNEELMQRLLSGKLEADDISELEKFRAEFSEKMSDAENIIKELTPEQIQEAAANPEFANVVGIVSADRSAAFIQSQMKELSVTDPDKFEEVSRDIRSLQSFKYGEFKKLDDEVKEKCKKDGFNADELMKSLAVSDGSKRAKALQELVKKEWGNGAWGEIKWTADFFSGGFFSKRKSADLEGMKKDIDDAFVVLDGYKKQMGSVLASTVLGNKDLLQAMSREVIGEPKKKEIVGMNDAKKLTPTDAKIEEEWTKHRKSVKNWDTLPDADKEAQRDSFSKKFSADGKKALAAKGGFWAVIFGALFESAFNSLDLGPAA